MGTTQPRTQAVRAGSTSHGRIVLAAPTMALSAGTLYISGAPVDLRVDKLAVSESLNTTGRSPRPASPASSTRAGQIAAGVLLVEPSVGKDPILASAGPRWTVHVHLSSNIVFTA